MNLPNKLTLGRIAAVPVFVLLYVKGLVWPAVAVYILASLTDMLDGQIARRRNLITNFGKIMDPLADKVLVYSAFCLFVGNGVMPAWMLMVILAREFIVAGIRNVAAADGKVIAAAMSGKIKTALQMIAVPLLVIRDIHPTIALPAQIFLWASLIMTVVSGIEYIYKNKEVFKG